MIRSRNFAIPAKQVESLVWCDCELVDWASGGIRYALDGTRTPAHVHYAYHFDAACVSVSGEHVALYERLGTKGLLLNRGKVAREFDRSFYHANAYEFPVAFARLSSGREVLIHCPLDYNRIDIDDVVTAERLTAGVERTPQDFFHSRLSVRGGYLLSAGWVWHPVDALEVYRLDDVLADPRTLDRQGVFASQHSEISSATFQNDCRILVSTSKETLADEEYLARPNTLRPSVVATWNLVDRRLVSQIAVSEPVGAMMALDSRFVVGFYDHPKVFDLATGEVVWSDSNLKTGRQMSSIIHHLDAIPPLAMDEEHRRFAVADEQSIHVVEFECG